MSITTNSDYLDMLNGLPSSTSVDEYNTSDDEYLMDESTPLVNNVAKENIKQANLFTTVEELTDPVKNVKVIETDLYVRANEEFLNTEAPTTTSKYDEIDTFVNHAVHEEKFNQACELLFKKNPAGTKTVKEYTAKALKYYSGNKDCVIQQAGFAKQAKIAAQIQTFVDRSTGKTYEVASV
jgi:hypothetical protein